MKGEKKMELTIRINDEDYERLTDKQKRGITAVLELDESGSSCCRNCTETTETVEPTEEKKVKRSRKTKKETPAKNNDSGVSHDNGRQGTSPNTNCTTNELVQSNGNEQNDTTESVTTVDAVKSAEPITEPAAQDSDSTGVTEPVVDEQKHVLKAAEPPSIETIQNAGATYITANPGKVAEFQQLFVEFGICKITDLASMPDKIGAFVDAMRAKGVNI